MSIEVLKDKNNLEYVHFTHESGSSCDCYLFGAHVTNFTDSKGNSVIFLSKKSKMDGKNAIRGGIPLIFPQFNKRGSLPKHGFARTSMWSFIGRSISSEEVVVTFALKNNDETMKIWPHPFELEYTLHLSSMKLTAEMKVINSGEEPFKFHALFHNYFNVPDIIKSTITGLRTAHYYTTVEKGEINDEEYHVPPSLDAVFPNGPNHVLLDKKDGTKVELLINNPLKHDVVIWNVGEEARNVSDFEPQDYKYYVCIEPGFIEDHVELNAKDSWTLSETIVSM